MTRRAQSICGNADPHPRHQSPGLWCEGRPRTPCGACHLIDGRDARMQCRDCPNRESVASQGGRSRTCPFCHATIGSPCWDEDSVFGKRVRSQEHAERRYGLTAEDIERGKSAAARGKS